MKTIGWLLVFAVVAAIAHAAGPAGRLHFEAAGFSIVPLNGASETESYQVVMMFLPPTEGFSPNVSVMVQPFGGTIEEYISLSRQQFGGSGLTVLTERASDSEVAWEYAGVLSGSRLHWFARAVLRDGKAYLITATATEAQWRTVSAELKACVESFTLENPGKRQQSRF